MNLSVTAYAVPPPLSRGGLGSPRKVNGFARGSPTRGAGAQRLRGCTKTGLPIIERRKSHVPLCYHFRLPGQRLAGVGPAARRHHHCLRRGLPQLCAAPLPPRHHRGRLRHRALPGAGGRRHHHPAPCQGRHRHRVRSKAGLREGLRRGAAAGCTGRQTPRAYAGQPLHRPRPRTAGRPRHASGRAQPHHLRDARRDPPLPEGRVFLPLGLPDGGQGRGGLGAGLLLRADRRRPHRRLPPRRQQRVCRWLRLHHHLHPKGRAGGGGDGAGRADPELNRNIPGAGRL